MKSAIMAFGQEYASSVKTADASNAGVVADSSIAAREPRQMLGKLLLVNMGELELDTSSLKTNRLETK